MNIANKEINKPDASKLNLQLKITTEPLPLKEKSPTAVKDIISNNVLTKVSFGKDKR